MTDKIELKVLFFAKARELIGNTNGVLVLEKEKLINITGHNLLEILIENYQK